jgi:hypothetical protein
MMNVLNGAVGTALADGDDLAVKAGDWVVSADASAFDTSVKYFEIMHWLRMIRDKLGRTPEEREFFWNVYRWTLMASMNVHAACNVGMVILPPYRSLRSGCPETHQMGTAIEYARAINCDWEQADIGIGQLNKYGWYRPEKQFKLKDTVTLSQLVVSRLRPKKIHGILARAGRALLEREDRGSPVLLHGRAFNELEDARIVSICANLYGHPKYKEFVTWVAERWKLRTSYRRMLKMILSLINKNRGGYGISTGRIEREALRETWSIFFREKSSRVDLR